GPGAGPPGGREWVVEVGWRRGPDGEAGKSGARGGGGVRWGNYNPPHGERQGITRWNRGSPPVAGEGERGPIDRRRTGRAARELHQHAPALAVLLLLDPLVEEPHLGFPQRLQRRETLPEAVLVEPGQERRRRRVRDGPEAGDGRAGPGQQERPLQAEHAVAAGPPAPPRLAGPEHRPF